MIAYTTFGTNDLERSRAFYDALFGEIGIGVLWSDDNFVGYGPSMDQPMFAISRPFDGKDATAGNGTMIAFACPDAATVDKVHAKALALGAENEGDAGRRGDSGFYCGYFRDPDGNKLNAFAMIAPTS